MTTEQLTLGFIFLAIAGMVYAITSLTGRARGKVAARIKDLAASEGPGPTGNLFRLPSPAAAPGPGLPARGRARGRERLRQRLLHAGYYRPEAEQVFKIARLALLIVPWPLALLAVLSGAVSLETGAAAGVVLTAPALVAPGMFLDRRKAARHRQFKKALPDFFDMLVMCLESGLALPAAWRKIGGEMREAYPLLHGELKVVEGEIELGGSTGEAIRRCGARTDLDELAGLASVVGQAERLGTGVAKPLRVLADTLRMQRVQRAEELAHKSATKIMFPTLLFIFPGVFAIILGPMAIQVMNLFGGAK